MKSNLITTALQTHSFRLTPQRLAILRVLQEAGQHLTPLKIFEQVKAILPGVTEATIYRTLNFLTSQGLALAAHVGNGQLVYEIAGHNHHHLICRGCGATHEIDHETLQALYDQFQCNTGYQVDSVHVTFFGLCPACQKSLIFQE